MKPQSPIYHPNRKKQEDVSSGNQTEQNLESITLNISLVHDIFFSMSEKRDQMELSNEAARCVQYTGQRSNIKMS